MKRFAFSVTLLAVSAILFFSFAQPAVSTGYLVGDRAEDFTLPNVDGRKVSLSDYPNAKGYIVVFTCNHCPYAQLYEQRLINLHNKFAPLGYPVIAINPNDPEVVPEDSMGEMKIRAAKKRYPFVYLLDENQKIYPKYGATRTPHVFLLDSTRHVRYIGTIDDNAESVANVEKKYVENAIFALMRGDNPNPDFTRAVGCQIRKK